MQKTWVSGYRTDQGYGAVSATEQGVCKVCLPGEQMAFALISGSAGESEISRSAAKQLEFYFKKSLQSFDIRIDISSLSVFYQRVLVVTRQIPYGRVVSYGQVAAQAGFPAAARAVGGALAANPIPIIIPCHRVVAASGTLTGYSGAGGVLMKKSLLALEGIDFKGNKNVCRVTVINSFFLEKTASFYLTPKNVEISTS